MKKIILTLLLLLTLIFSSTAFFACSDSHVGTYRHKTDLILNSGWDITIVLKSDNTYTYSSTLLFLGSESVDKHSGIYQINGEIITFIADSGTNPGPGIISDGKLTIGTMVYDKTSLDPITYIFIGIGVGGGVLIAVIIMIYNKKRKQTQMPNSQP